MPDVPHFAHPFRFQLQHNGTFAAAVEEQHSIEEVADCCVRIASFPIGSRSELPEFGITPQEFRVPPLDAEQLITEVSAWEERASFENPEALIDVDDDLSSAIRAAVVGSEGTGGNV